MREREGHLEIRNGVEAPEEMLEADSGSVAVVGDNQR